MLRPERMSKVSVTGSKSVMDRVVETVYDLNLVHVTDYNGSWEGFAPGEPGEGAEDAADKLVTVRSLESMLGVDADEAGPARIVTDEALDEELAEVRDRVNELDDRRDDLRDRLREVEERVDAVEPFADLGIDLDLLQGYDTLEVLVGEGDRDEVERALVDAEGVTNYELFSGDGEILAVFAYPDPDADPDAVQDALVGVDFATLEVPTVDEQRVSPDEYLREIEAERQGIESDLDDVEDDLEAVRMDAGGFLLAAEERLTIEVQKQEAPLSFATTENAFVAEGWIPTERYTEFASALQDAVGSHVEVEELERAAFGSDGEVQLREQVPPATAEAASGREETGEDDEEEEPQRAVADGSGGGVVMRDDDPPVIQDNPGAVRPFEVLVRAVGRPQYSEFDPTVIMFLTFPAFFGFMIGDLGYGLLYTLIGYFLYTNYDADAYKSMGGVAITAGLFTMVFGVLYGEVFGLHLIATYFWEGALGMSTPLHKGLQPYYSEWATAWLVVSIVASVVHLDIGYAFSFVENYEFHGLKDAVLESGSWLLMLNGFWVFVLSDFLGGSKPEFLFTVFAGEPISLGFAGFSTVVGQAGLGAFLLGLVMIWASGEWGEAIEALFLQVFVNGLSYTRLAAVLLAKAGMAFVVNLLFFGVYVTGEGGEAEWHFGLSGMPAEAGVTYHGHEVTEIMFGGLMHGGAAALVGGLLILVFGHLIVLALGVTSAGLQAVRLEYYEFFSKFFEGGGTEYEPLGYEREHTTSE